MEIIPAVNGCASAVAYKMYPSSSGFILARVKNENGRKITRKK